MTPTVAASALEDHAQATFRVLLRTMAYPGRLFRPPEPPIQLPAPLDAATGACALTLLDRSCTVWLDTVLASPAVKSWLRLQTGVEEATQAEATFALIGDPWQLDSLDGFRLGTDAASERSATLVLRLPHLSGGAPTRLAGPGINGSINLCAALPEWFWPTWDQNAARYPIGIDVFLTDGREFCALPRTVRRL